MMSLTELRKKLIKQVEASNDLKLLEELKSFLEEREKYRGKDILDELSPEQYDELMSAIKESEDEANLVSNEQVVKEAKQWLKRKK